MTLGSARDRATPAARAEAGTRATRLAILLGIVAVAVFVASIAAFAVGGGSRQVESGTVVVVQATSLSDVQGFSIRTSDGRTVDFRIRASGLENGGSFPPGHLAEHRVTLERVRVTYVRAGGSNEALRIEDAT